MCQNPIVLKMRNTFVGGVSEYGQICPQYAKKEARTLRLL